jgi:peptidoglycan/LPS O-acetylase OafA/YrhL
MEIQRGARLDALTSLRFFAAFAIVIHHNRGFLLPSETLAEWPLGQGVSLFFVLSGFILVHVYPELPSKEAVRGFWLARIGRIWPAHLVALTLVLIITGTQTLGGHSPAIFLANLFMIHSWIPSREYFFSFNALSWTISTELGFYVLFPFLIYRFGATWMWKLLAAAALLLGIIVSCTIWKIPSYSDSYNGVTNFSLLYISPLGRLFEFVLGMSTALWWHRLRPLVGSNVWIWTLAEVAAVGAALWCMRYGTYYLIQMAQLTKLPVAQEWLIHAGSCFSFAALIWIMASGTGLIGRFFSSPLFVFLGEISYATYMLHQVMMDAYRNYLPWLPAIPHQLEFLAFAAVLLVTSALVYLFIEQPLRTRIRSLGLRRKQQAQLTAV